MDSKSLSLVFYPCSDYTTCNTSKVTYPIYSSKSLSLVIYPCSDYTTCNTSKVTYPIYILQQVPVPGYLQYFCSNYTTCNTKGKLKVMINILFFFYLSSVCNLSQVTSFTPSDLVPEEYTLTKMIFYLSVTLPR